MKKWALVFIAVITLAACSKDDGGEENNPIINGTEIFTSQIVKISVPDADLTENEYQGTFGSAAITLTRLDENTLAFIAPTENLGINEFKIPALNIAANYNLKETVLGGSPEQAVAPLLANLASYNQTLTGNSTSEAATMQQNLESFNNFMANTTTENKRAAAVAYIANKALIDEIILNDYSNVAGKFTYDDKVLVTKFVLAILSIDIGSTLAVNGGHPGVRALGILVAGIATTSAIHFYKEFIDEEVKEIGVSFAAIAGINGKNTNSTTLNFTNDENKIMAFTTTSRKPVLGDAQDTAPMAVKLFEGRASYNYIINKVNAAIQWANNNVPFISFGLMETANLPATATPVVLPADQDMFDNFTFSITHPNLTLVSANLQSDGQIAVKVKITGTSSIEPVESHINYTYSDEFSSYFGKFPIKVEGATNPLVGTWIMESFNDGYLAGEYEDITAGPQCPNLVYAQQTYTSMTYTFSADNTWSISQTAHMLIFGYEINTANCTITVDGPDTTQDISGTNQGTNQGTYTYNGTSVTTVGITGSPYTQTVTIINENRIKIGSQVFNRQ